MMRKLIEFGNRRFLDPVYVLPFLQISPGFARILDTILYYLFIMALGVIGAGYIAILEFTEGASKAYRALLVMIIVVSLSMFAAAFYDFRITNIFLPLLISLIALSALSRAIRLFRGQKPEDLTVNRRTWRFVIAILASVVVVSVGAGVNSILRGGSDTLHYLAESQKRQEREIKQQGVTIQKNQAQTQEVKTIAVELAKGLSISLMNQVWMRSALNKAEQKNERLERKLAATTRTVNKSATTVSEIQTSQVEVKRDLQAVVAKTDSVKAVVAAVLPDTTRIDSSKAIAPLDTPRAAERKRGLFRRVFGRKD